MERATLFQMTTLIFCIMLLNSSCNDDKNEQERIRIETLVIAPNLELSGTIPDTKEKVPVMVAIKEDSDEKYYLHIGRIKGFEYEEGNEYKLKVLITTINNPPMDGHIENFELIEILSKTKIVQE